MTRADAIPPLPENEVEEAEGLEPPTLAGNCFRDSVLIRPVCFRKMEPSTGIEPATRCLQDSRSSKLSYNGKTASRI